MCANGHLGTLQVHNAITSCKLENTSLRSCVLRASCRHANIHVPSKVGFYFLIPFLDVSISPFSRKLVYVQYMRMRLVPPDEERLLAIVTTRPRSLPPCVWPSPPLTLAYTERRNLGFCLSVVDDIIPVGCICVGGFSADLDRVGRSEGIWVGWRASIGLVTQTRELAGRFSSMHAGVEYFLLVIYAHARWIVLVCEWLGLCCRKVSLFL